MSESESFKNLYKKMDATSKTRFHASRRLRLHAKLSTYTVVVLSLVLILVSLMQAYDLGENIKRKEVVLLQVFASIAVLVYSLLIEKNDFSNRSEKMYSCASKLGELKQKAHPFKQGANFDQAKYDVCWKDYHDVLKLYETHSNNDFRGDYLRAKLEMPEDYVIKGWDKFVMSVKVWGLYILNFVTYPVVAAVLVLALYWVWAGFPPASEQADPSVQSPQKQSMSSAR
ncbi:SLATT domain-containing protein [Pseudomonas putida]|uniref:SLATT domain-containing protein n=1 Tax=Pseudomonas putida TaxID=303 RepID=UPI00349E6C4A